MVEGTGDVETQTTVSTAPSQRLGAADQAGLASATTVPSIVAPARAKPIAASRTTAIPWADVGDKRLGGAAALHDVADQDAGEQPHAHLARRPP